MRSGTRGWLEGTERGREGHGGRDGACRPARCRLGGCVSVTLFISLLLLASIGAGFLGALTGLGGGVVLIPVIAGISYEIIRFAARRQGSFLALLTAPGLWLQRITTQPPDDQAVAVAIHALNGAMELEKKQGGELVIA